jgi:hypothetical protein
MFGMSAKNPRQDGYDQNKSLRVTYPTEAALDRTVANLREMRDLKFRDGRINAQAFVNASWLMLEAMETEILANLLRPHLARLEALLRGEPDPGHIDHPQSGRPAASHSQTNSLQPRAADVNRPARVVNKRRTRPG